MIVLVSPTKTQQAVDTSHDAALLFPDKTETLREILQTLSYEDIKTMYKISDKQAQKLYADLQHYDERHPALLAYHGLTFKTMRKESWTETMFEYAKDHLLIFSAFYGLLRPHDAISHYRLDFKQAFPLDLYAFWQDTITQKLNHLQEPLLNLASQEYSRMIKFEALNVPFIDVIFNEVHDSIYTIKGTPAKQARGEATRLIMEQEISTLEALKKLEILNHVYNLELSNDEQIVFTKTI